MGGNFKPISMPRGKRGYTTIGDAPRVVDDAERAGSLYAASSGAQVGSDQRWSSSSRVNNNKTRSAAAAAVVFATCILAGSVGLVSWGGSRTSASSLDAGRKAGAKEAARDAVRNQFSALSASNSGGTTSKGISKDFDADGRFILPHFDARKPFSSFLPGIGGEWGFPLWAFYVNRGQAIACFGVENKNGPIAEFQPANKAYQVASESGFRTMLRATRVSLEDENTTSVTTSQPFFEPDMDGSQNRTMLIGMNELEIMETDAKTEIDTKVLYYTVPGEEFPALVRRVTFSNTGETPVELEIVDGLARLEPFGVNQGMLSAMGRTLEGWMRVYNCDEEEDEDGTTIIGNACFKPYFKLSASTADTAQVAMIVAGNFALAYVEGESPHELLPIVVDPVAVFDRDTTLRDPYGFFKKSESIEDLIYSRNEMKASKTPCAFAALSRTLPPGKSLTLVQIYGHATSLNQLNKVVVPSVTGSTFVADKYKQAVGLTDRLTSAVHSSTSNALFDAFARQAMLDNLLRGGYPEFLGAKSDPKVYHTFSRIHGDLERDYNNFQIDASFYSQGSGNYRDVNQNRRVDVLLFPALEDFNLREFLTLKQADGYNPLTVTTAFFLLNGGADELATATTMDEASADALADLLDRPFRPGQLFTDAYKRGVNLTLPPKEFLDTVAAASTQVYSANYTHEGFWADHWTYDLDQMESFEAIYPDRLEYAMWDAPKLAFYMSSGTVQPRDFKYVEVTIKGDKAIRQYNAVYDDPDKAGQLADRLDKPDGFYELALDESGLTDEDHTYVYKVSPVAKLLLLCVTRMSELDPSGMGMEMEANKPGWNDAMNGLPGLLGSGMPETAETLRLARWLSTLFRKYPSRDVSVPIELNELIVKIDDALDTIPNDDFKYWNFVATAREDYRYKVRLFFSGDEVTISNGQLIQYLSKYEKKLERAIEKSLQYSPDGIIMPTYFAHEVVEYEYTGYESYLHQPFVRALKFETQVFPLFLEGPVRQLKTVARDDGNALTKIHDAVAASKLYDAPIGQYKICESLEGQPFEMGRMMAFTPGWLENESIWLHMSFKYYLELLRAGLYDQFWHAMATGAPYNMDVDVYGRSPLECSSFIVSSAYPDSNLWGAGFLARLSGSTAEFLSMWTHLMAGPKPFKLSGANTLELALTPSVPAFLFKSDNTVTFKFLGGIFVTYHNPARADTWTTPPVKYVLHPKKKGAQKITLRGPIVPSPYAVMIRDLEYDTIDVYLG